MKRMELKLCEGQAAEALCKRYAASTEMSEPAAFEIVNPEGTSPYVLTCEHASNYIPARYNRLGLPEAELERHIAYDIGCGRNVAAAIEGP